MANQSTRYLLINQRNDKKISLAITIEGLPDILTNRIILVPFDYGDPDIAYGDVGLLYGGLRAYEGARDIMSLDSSSLTINQRLEPEQGKGSVSLMTLAFIDKDQFMTQLLSPGVLIPDILGAQIKIDLGYEQLAYPNEYFTVFRGYASNVSYRSGLVLIQLSDPGVKQRAQVFYSGKSTLTASITSVQTAFSVNNAAEFHKQILGPNGSYDPAVTTYMKIEDEFIRYPSTQPSGNSFTGVTRGQRSTVSAAHAINTEALSYVQLQDHSIDMALKIMLSGWSGPWKSDVPIRSVVKTFEVGLGDIANAIVFPEFVDVKREYGLTIGDYVTISGSGISGNNAQRFIVDIIDKNPLETNNIVLLSTTLTAEFPTSAVVAFRSKYDTYPLSCGLKLTPNDVDVEGHEEIKAAFLADNENSYQFILSGPQGGKSFIENQIYLPLAMYSVTRYGRLSVKLTKPPIAGEDLIILNQDNILDPVNITVERGLNSRKFFNEIIFDFDYSDSGEYLNTSRTIDSESLSIIKQSSTLRIQSQGAKSLFSINVQNLFTRRATNLLSRYKRGAIQIGLSVNYGTGNIIEGGDIVALDGSGLSIANWDNGTRSFGTQLFEVVERSLDVKTGITRLKLVAGVGGSTTDRFGVISPSSRLDTGSTSTVLRIKDSYTASSPKYPLNERKKWASYVGLPILVHNENYSVAEETTFTGFDNADTTIMYVSGLSFTPPADYIIDLPHYPLDTNPEINSLYKAVHAHLSPTLTVVTGITNKSFTVSALDAAKAFPGQRIKVHNYSFSILSPEVTISSVVGVTITTLDSLGFIPAAGQFVSLVGFPDGGGAYRIF